jgi:N-acetylmuramoyl-L-alanine amidase CwlA
MEKLEIIQDLMPAGILGTSTPLEELRGITIHDTGNASPGAGARWHGRYLKGAYARERQASWHFAVDDTEIVQSAPTSQRTWHAGKGNPYTISIEICVNRDGNIQAATDRAARLCAHLLKIHGLPVDGHVYQHYDWTGKNCPAQLRKGNPITWDQFLSLVESYYEVV